MKITMVKETAARSGESNWFAWRPVVAERSTKNGIEYVWVWLSTVKRKYVRAMGMGKWAYTVVE